MDKLLVILILTTSIFNACEGLRCWTCDNQPSMFDCMFRGKMKRCLPNQESCETKVRRCGTKIAVTKRCKQTQACLTNARLQVTPDQSGITECNTDQENSICTCCCEGERCNLNSNPCRGMEFSCERRQSILDGNVTCSNENAPRSVCRYECTDAQLVVSPFQSQETFCLPYGQWSQPIPCCTRPCPPFLLNDVLFMRQASSVAAWEEFQRRVVSVVSQFALSNDSTRVGLFSYGGKVHDDLVVYLPEFMENREGFLEKVLTLPYTNDTEDVQAGAALTYALDDYFTPNRGDRPGVRNVIILQADNRSSDDVLEIAETLRQRGFVTYAVGSIFNTDEVYQRQLLEIAGSPERLFYEQDPLDQSYLEDIILHLCRDPCNNIPGQQEVEENNDYGIVLGDEYID